jgi:hypothetical protein
MRTAACVVCLAAAVSAAATAAGPRPQSQPAATRPATSPSTRPTPAALTATLNEAIELIESKKHEELIRLLVEPKELDRWLKQTTMEQVIDNFKGRKAEDLLLILKQVRGGAPVIDREGRRATYKLTGAVRQDVDFVKVGEKWYLSGP